MKIAKNSFNLVIAGKWNRYILTPDFVGKELFDKENVIVEFSMDLDLPPRYKMNSTIFVPESKRVLIIATDTAESVLTKIQSSAKNLVSILQHTPYQAFGVNYGFTISQVNEKELLNKLFDFDDNTLYSGDGFSRKNYIINRAFEKDDYTLNLIITSLENGNYMINVNFNYALNEYSKILEVIDKNVFINNYSITKEFLSKNYNLKLEEDGQ